MYTHVCEQSLLTAKPHSCFHCACQEDSRTLRAAVDNEHLAKFLRDSLSIQTPANIPGPEEDKLTWAQVQTLYSMVQPYPGILNHGSPIRAPGTQHSVCTQPCEDRCQCVS